jgi:hypothetical protein
MDDQHRWQALIAGGLSLIALQSLAVGARARDDGIAEVDLDWMIVHKIPVPGSSRIHADNALFSVTVERL